MTTKIFIDQSGKIEDTARPTVLALSNDVQISIILPAKEKQEIQLLFRNIKQPENFYYFTFAALLAILLVTAKTSKKIFIDREYYGHEEAIKDRLNVYITKLASEKFNTPIIEFCLVGKESPAHIFASQVSHKFKKPNKKIKSRDLIKLIFPNKKDRVSHHPGPRTV